MGTPYAHQSSFQGLLNHNHIVTANNYSYTMFFFFVGGVEPTVKQTIQTSVAPCPNCHEGSMDLVEMCKTFKAFFIPIWSFGDSRQVLRCNRCKCIMAPSFGGIANRQVMANGNNNGGRQFALVVEVPCSLDGTFVRHAESIHVQNEIQWHSLSLQTGNSQLGASPVFSLVVLCRHSNRKVNVVKMPKSQSINRSYN